MISFCQKLDLLSVDYRLIINMFQQRHQFAMISIFSAFLTYEKQNNQMLKSPLVVRMIHYETDHMQKVETLPLGPMWTSNDPLYLITVPMRKL